MDAPAEPSGGFSQEERKGGTNRDVISCQRVTHLRLTWARGQRESLKKNFQLTTCFTVKGLMLAF